MKNNFYLMSPDETMELYSSIAPDQRQARLIDDCLRTGRPIVLRQNGQPEREQVLVGWLRKRGAKVAIIDRFIEFEQPRGGRGGEVAYMQRKNLVRRENDKEENKEEKPDEKSVKGGERA